MPLPVDNRVAARRDLVWAISVGGIAVVAFTALVVFPCYFAATLFLILAGMLLGVSLNAMTTRLGSVIPLPHALRLTVVCLVLAGLLSGVVFLGGSLTWGAGASDPMQTSYRALMGKKLQAFYENYRITSHDAAIGGTGSHLGVFRLDRDVLRHKPGPHGASCSTDIWPLQWRMAVSWVSGYLTIPLFAPMLARAPGWGPIEAGRMGVSISVAAKIGDVAMAWMNTKAAPFGRLVALRQFKELDRLFFRSLAQSTALGVAGAASVWTLALVLSHHGSRYAARFLSPLGLALMLCGFLISTVLSSMGIYLRAHKQEKFMVNSVLGAVYMVPTAWFLGHRYGGMGIAAGFAGGSLVIGLGDGTYTFLKWRRIWHAA